MLRTRIGIIGHGFVGQAVENGFGRTEDQVINVYDKYKNVGSLDQVVNESDVIFICVPTPMKMSDETGYGQCDTSIVEEVIYEACDVAKARKVFVIKSTLRALERSWNATRNLLACLKKWKTLSTFSLILM